MFCAIFIFYVCVYVVFVTLPFFPCLYVLHIYLKLLLFSIYCDLSLYFYRVLFPCHSNFLPSLQFFPFNY
ncbi:unnamed protein product [Darwinula stevensoni]|uniref:Uncharacterized protein n=1 Tax=Darwinula stevensoni TaxID=69355 RepID=A0A7R9AHU7_9CRUS|nr:unnamed protein product [Darwinula stevensoni]CAG0905681.1 unnamed protein product [Darwinula stevensoni]